MDLDILKHFIRLDVEVLIGGVWLEGNLQPIAKGVVVLLPLPDMAAFYGPASLRAEDIQAIRQVKRTNPNTANVNVNPPDPVATRSSFESVTPSIRFAVKKPGQL